MGKMRWSGRLEWTRGRGREGKRITENEAKLTREQTVDEEQGEIPAEVNGRG